MYSVGESLVFTGETWGLPDAEDVRRRRRRADRKGFMSHHLKKC